MDQVLSPTIAGVVSLMLPIVIDIVNTKVKESKIRYWIAVGSSLAIGGISTVIVGGYNPETLLASIGASFMVSQSVFSQYWKNSLKRTLFQAELKSEN